MSVSNTNFFKAIVLKSFLDFEKSGVEKISGQTAKSIVGFLYKYKYITLPDEYIESKKIEAQIEWYQYLKEEKEKTTIDILKKHYSEVIKNFDSIKEKSDFVRQLISYKIIADYFLETSNDASLRKNFINKLNAKD